MLSSCVDPSSDFSHQTLLKSGDALALILQNCSVKVDATAHMP
jgi:hypothetical protein